MLFKLCPQARQSDLDLAFAEAEALGESRYAVEIPIPPDEKLPLLLRLRIKEARLIASPSSVQSACASTEAPDGTHSCISCDSSVI